MRKWLKALFKETLASSIWVLSLLGTLVTFFWKAGEGKPRLASFIAALVGFAWANLRVYERQEDRIRELEGKLATVGANVSKLRVSAEEGSRYILKPVDKPPHGDFKGGYFEFHLMVENTGSRDSTVRTFNVEVLNLNKSFSNLEPSERRPAIQGRHCVQGIALGQSLSKSGIVRIRANNATDRGILLFFLPDLSMDEFINAGLHMEGPERKFRSLQCRLTLADTTNSSASGTFELHEE